MGQSRRDIAIRQGRSTYLVLSTEAEPTVMVIRNSQERRLALALQGGGSFGAFTWGVPA